MAVTFSATPGHLMWTNTKYVVAQKLRGRTRYPIVLMLEPLLRCNLACAGCGKIQYPAHILKKQLTPEQCFAAAEECGAPLVSIPGGEPLLHPQIGEIVDGLVASRKYVVLCTNAVLMEEKLNLFTPSKYLSFSIHLDGPRSEHDFAVCREGTYDVAINAIKAGIAKGFRVTTNTTLFAGADPQRYRDFFDEVMALGVEGMTISPGYSYQKAPDQQHFMRFRKSVELFRALFENPRPTWRFNQSPGYVDFLLGNVDFECTPWGNVTYNVFGWQRPCYLIGEGYARSFRELMEETDWNRYGRRSCNEKCKDCMVHVGFEPSSVDYTFGSLRGFLRTARTAITGRIRLRDINRPIFVPANRTAKPPASAAAPTHTPLPAAGD